MIKAAFRLPILACLCWSAPTVASTKEDIQPIVLKNGINIIENQLGLDAVIVSIFENLNDNGFIDYEFLNKGNEDFKFYIIGVEYNVKKPLASGISVENHDDCPGNVLIFQDRNKVDNKIYFVAINNKTSNSQFHSDTSVYMLSKNDKPGRTPFFLLLVKKVDNDQALCSSDIQSVSSLSLIKQVTGQK